MDENKKDGANRNNIKNFTNFALVLHLAESPKGKYAGGC